MTSLTVLNFSGEPVTGSVHSEYLEPGAGVFDMFADEEIASVDDLRSFNLTLEAYEGRSLLVPAQPSLAENGTTSSRTDRAADDTPGKRPTAAL